MLVVVMRASAGEVLGILSVDEPVSGRRPSDEALDALVTVAGFAGLAIEQAQEAARNEEHRVALEHLLSISSRIAEARSSEVVLAAVCSGIRDALGFERVAAELADASGRLTPLAAAGWTVTDPAVHLDLTAADFETLMRPEYEQQGCYLLGYQEAAAILGRGIDGSYESRLNGRGPRAWYRHWLVVPLRTADGALRGMIWADDPTDRLRARHRAAAGATAIRRPGALGARGGEPLRAHAPPCRARPAHRPAEPDRLPGPASATRSSARARRAHGRAAVPRPRPLKAINDTWGHEAGDLILQTVASRIDESLRRATPSRVWAVTSYVVLCEDIGNESEAMDIARRLRMALNRPIEIQGDRVTISASVGVALPSGAAEDAETLLHAADTAMYRAKGRGRDSSAIASAAMRAGPMRVPWSSERARRADRGEIHVYYSRSSTWPRTSA